MRHPDTPEPGTDETRRSNSGEKPTWGRGFGDVADGKPHRPDHDPAQQTWAISSSAARLFQRIRPRWLQTWKRPLKKPASRTSITTTTLDEELFRRVPRPWHATTPCAYFRDPRHVAGIGATREMQFIIARAKLLAGGLGNRSSDIGCGLGAGSRCNLAENRWGLGRRLDAEFGATGASRRAESVATRAWADRVEFRLQDYRGSIMAQYGPAIVSVGMFEHVGRRNFPQVFRSTENSSCDPQGPWRCCTRSARPGRRTRRTRWFSPPHLFRAGTFPSLLQYVGPPSRSQGSRTGDLEILRPALCAGDA